MGGFDRINGVPSDPDEYVGSGGAKGEISSVLHVNTTQNGTAADTNETDLWTYTLPANTLNADGKAIRITAWGTTGATANNKTIRLKFGAGTPRTHGPTAANNVGWVITVIVVRTGASTQLSTGTGIFSEVSPGTQVVGSLAEDTATAITIKVTGQNGTAAADDIVFRGAIVESLN